MQSKTGRNEYYYTALSYLEKKRRFKLTSVPVNADLVINDDLEVVVCVDDPDAGTNLLGVLVGADDDGVGVGCLQLDWLVKDGCEDLDQVHAHLCGCGKKGKDIKNT